jgi:hypothetical protein
MAKINYDNYLVRRPIREVAADKVGKVFGHQVPTMTYMSNKLVPGCNTYIDLSWIYQMPSPNPHIFEHAHDFDEIIVHMGTDPEHPEDLGGEIEIYMEDQPLVFDTTSAIYIPRGVKHDPLTWRKFTRPHLEMTIMLGTGDFGAAAPGVGSKT